MAHIGFRVFIPDFFGRRISIPGIGEFPGCAEAVGRQRWSRLCKGFRAATKGSGWTGYFEMRPNGSTSLAIAGFIRCATSSS